MKLNKMIVLAILLMPVLVYGQIRINEVFYDPDGSDSAAEWIEISNKGNESVNLLGWLLDISGPNFVFPEFNLAPGKILVIHTNAEENQLPVDHEIWFAGGSNMGNTHGFVGLWNSEVQNVETIVDYMEYGSSGHSWESAAVERGLWMTDTFAPDVDAGYSLHLTGSGHGVDNWEIEIEPYPGEMETALVEFCALQCKFEAEKAVFSWKFYGNAMSFILFRKDGERAKMKIAEIPFNAELVDYQLEDIEKPDAEMQWFISVRRNDGSFEELAGPLDLSADFSELEIPQTPELLSVWPNPFNPDCRVNFNLPSRMKAKISLFDLMGHERAIVFDGILSAGVHSRRITMNNYPAGPYFVVLDTAMRKSVMQVLFVK
jgi:hypothetical protein